MSLSVCPNKNTKAWKHLENLVGEDRALALYIANNEKTPYAKFDIGLRAVSYSWDQILNIKKNLRKYNHRFNSSHMLTQPQPIGQSTLYKIELIEDWGSKVVPKSSNSYEYDPSDKEDKTPDWVKELEALQAPMVVTKSGNQYISLTGNVYSTYAEAIEDKQSNLGEEEAFIKFGEKYLSLLSYAKEYRDDILNRYGIQKIKGIHYYHLSSSQTDRISTYEKGKPGKYKGKPVGSAQKGFNLLDNLDGELNYRIENGKGYMYIDVKELVTRDGFTYPETVHYLKLPVTLVAADDLEIFKRSVFENEAYEALFDKEVKKYLFKTKRATPFQAANFTLLQLEQLVVAALAGIGNPMTLSQFRQLSADEKLAVVRSLGLESIIDKAVDTYEKALQSIKPEDLKQEIQEIFQDHFQGQEKTDFKNILDVLPADFLKLITFEHLLAENAYFRRASAKNKIDIPAELVALQQVYDMRVAYAMNVALRSMMDDGLVTEEEVKELNRKILPAVKAKVKGSLTEKIGKYKAIITTLKHGDKFRSYWDAAVNDIGNIVSDKNKGLSELIALYSSKLGGLSTVFTEVALGDIDPARLKFKYDRNTVAIHELGHAVDFYLTSTKPNERIKILAFINDLIGRQEFQDYLEKGLKSRGYNTKNTEEITADLFAWVVGKAAGYDVRSGHLESLDDFFAKNWELANDIYSLHFDLDVKEGIASTIVDWMRIQLNKLIDTINSKLNFPLFKPFTDSSTGIEVFPEYNNYHVANLFQDIRDMILDSDMYDIRKILTSQTQKDFNKLRIESTEGITTKEDEQVLGLTKVSEKTPEGQQKFAKARSVFELHPSIPSKNAREVITTLRGMMVEAIAAQTLNAAKAGKKNFKPTAMKKGVLIVLPYLHKEYQKLLDIPEAERSAEQNFTIAQWEILSSTEVLPKLQKFIMLELKQLGYKFDSEGLAEAPKEDESTLSSTIEQDETMAPDKSILDVLVEGEDENQVGKGSQGNDYAGMSRSTKSTLSTIVKGWLSGIPTTTPSIIGFGKNTYKDLNEVVAVLNSLLRDKATGDEQIAALKKAATQSKEREWLNIIADRLKNEKAIDSPIYNQFVTKFYQKFNQLRLVRTYFEPKGYEATENGVKRFFPLKDKAGNLIYSLTVKVINLNREDVPKNLRDAWANNFLMGSFSIESEGRFQGMTTVNPEMREAIKEAYNNFRTFASINYNVDRGWTSPNMAKEKLNNLFQLIGVDLNAPTLEDLLNGFNLDGDKQTFVPYTSKVKGSAFSPKSGFMAQIFDPILEGTETTNNPFGSSGMIRVSEIMSQYIDDYVNTSVSDGKGRKLWAYGIADPNWVEHSKIITSATEKTPDGKSLTDAEYEKTYIGQILKDKYSGRSRILNKLRDLRNKPKDLKAFSEALQIFSFNTLKGQGATEGKELKNMVEAEHIFTKIALFTDVKKAIANSKIIQMFITTPSDKSRMECITTLKLNKAFKIDPKTGTISIQEAGTKTFFNYFLAEYDRIKEFQAASPEARARFMSNENYLPEVFYHFPQFNDRNYIWKPLDGRFVLRDLDEKLPNGMTVEDYIKSKLNSLALSAVESSRKMWEDSGIIKDGKLITSVPQEYVDEEVDASLTKKDALKIIYDQLKSNPTSVALKEKALELEAEVQRNATNYLIADYALNYLAHNMEMHMFLLGDPAMYVKDTRARNNALKEIDRVYLTEEELKNSNVDTIINFVRDVITHLGKRMAGVQGSRQAAADSKGRVTRVLKIADNLLINGKRTNFISKELADKVYEDLLGKDFVDKFKDIQPGDGQGLMSAKEDLYLKYRYGKIDKDTYTTILKKVMDASEDLKNGLPIRESAKFTDKEKFYTQPIKPLIFANKLDTVPNGDKLIFKRKVIYTKNSEFALYPQWTEGLEIDKFRVLMDNTNTDRIAFLSSIKTGADNVIDGVFLQDEDGTILINDEVVENFENFVAEDIDREYFGIQLEIPYDESKNKIRIGTQQIKALFDEVLDETFDFNGKKVKGSFLQTLQAKIYGRMVNNKLNSLFTEMGATPLYKGLPIEPEDLKNVSIDQLNFSFSNLEALSKTLIEHAEAQGYSTNVLEGLKLTDDKQSFVVPLLFNGNLAKFEKLLLSMIKNVIFQKINGKSFVLGTELGILPKKRKTRVVEGKEGAEEIKKYRGGIVFVKGQDSKGFGERGLLGPRLKDKNNPNGEWLPGQVIIPWKFKAPLEQFIIDTPEGKFLDTSKMDEDLLKLIGIRIPTQGHPSMASIEIVGFLPKWAGDLMIAPQDFVAQFGYDFDVDKMYNYIYNYIYGDTQDKAELKKLKKQTREMFLKEMENVENIPVEFKQALAYIKAADEYDDARYKRAEFRDFIEKNVGVRPSKLSEMMEYFDTLSLEDINKINQAAYTEKGRLLHIKQATARGKTLKDHKKLADFISKENLGKTIAIKKAMTEYNAFANDEVEQLYPEYEKYEDYLSTYKETKEMSKERKAIQEKINAITKAQRLSKVEPNKDDLDDNDQAQLENYLMDVHHAVLSNPTVIKKSLEGIGEGKIKDLASTIKGFFQKDSNATYLPFSDKEKVLEFFDNAAGKIGTGIFSVAITFFALIQGKDVYLQTFDADNKPVTKPFRIKNNDGTPVDLSKLSAYSGVNRLISIFQSASLDNAKYKALYAISQNEETMGVTAILGALYNPEATEFDEEYITYFLMQPAIQEYIEVLKSAKNSLLTDGLTRAEAQAFYLEIFNKYEKKLAEIYKKQGFKEEDIQEQISAALLNPGYSLNTITDDQGVEFPGLKDFFENQARMANEEEFLKAQIALLNDFVYLKNAADELRSIQYVINSDSKGTAPSLFEGHYKEKRFRELFGEKEIKYFSSGIYGILYNEDTPSISFLMSQVAFMANRIFNGNDRQDPILPFLTSKVGKLFDTMMEITGRTGDQTFNQRVVKEMFNSYLSYIWTNPNFKIADSNMQQERFNLLVDSENTSSLGTQLQEFKKTELYFNNPRLHPLISSLKVVPHKEYSDLKFVFFNASAGLVVDDEDIRVALDILHDEAYPLFESLMKYQLVMQGYQSSTNMRGLIPIYYFEGFDFLPEMQRLNRNLNGDYDREDLVGAFRELQTSTIIPKFIEQHLQHYPERAARMNEEYAEPYSIPIFDKQGRKTGVKKDTSQYIVDFKTLGDGNTNYYKVKDDKNDYVFPYLQIYDTDKKMYRLYRLAEKVQKGYLFKEMPILGVNGVDEFDMGFNNEDVLVSMFPENNSKLNVAKLGYKLLPMDSSNQQLVKAGIKVLTTRNSKNFEGLWKMSDGLKVQLLMVGQIEYNPQEHTIDIWKAGKIIDKMPAETYAKQEGFKNFADLKEYVQNGEGLSLTPGFLTGKQKPYLYKISINTVGRYAPTVQEAIEADLRKKIANDLIVEKC